MLQGVFVSEEIYGIAEPVAVVIDKAWKNITPPERDLLARILAAVDVRPGQKLSLNAVRLVVQPIFNTGKLPGSPSRVITFTQLPDEIPQYEVIRAASATIVAAEPLRALTTNPNAKNRLWAALQIQFGMGTKAA